VINVIIIASVNISSWLCGLMWAVIDSWSSLCGLMFQTLCSHGLLTTLKTLMVPYRVFLLLLFYFSAGVRINLHFCPIRQHSDVDCDGFVSSLKSSLSVNTSLIHAFISWRLDYCNALLYNTADSQVWWLQSVQNTAARLVTGLWRTEHITPTLKSRRSLPIFQRVTYKLAFNSAAQMP